MFKISPYSDPVQSNINTVCIGNELSWQVAQSHVILEWRNGEVEFLLILCFHSREKAEIKMESF